MLDPKEEIIHKIICNKWQYLGSLIDMDGCDSISQSTRGLPEGSFAHVM